MTQDTPPDTAQQWFARGTVHAGRREYDEALDCFRHALELRPADPAPHSAIGLIYAQTNRVAQTLSCYRDICALEPTDPDIWHSLGWMLEQIHELDEAVRCYQQSIQRNPRADGSYNNLANCLLALGRFDEAHEAWRVAIEIAPECTLYYRNLVQSKQLDAGDPCFVSLQTQVARAASLPPANQAELHFAYGQALTDMGEAERGFGHFVQANTQYRKTIKYDEAATLGFFAQLPGIVTADLLHEKHGLGDPSDAPIFIIGMPRSGSTLVEQILASHPQVVGMGERADFGQALTVAVTEGQNNGANGIRIEALSELSAAHLSSLGADYLQRITQTAGKNGPYQRFVDKFPYNFVNAGLIHLALPNARFIHTRRSPVDTCLSIYSRQFRDVPFGYDLGELGRYYRAYDALVAHWCRVLPEGTILEVQYEDLVDQFEPNVRRILAHCGLQWDDRCLAFHQTKRAVNTASSRQVRKPLFRTSLKRWRPSGAMLLPLYEGLGARLCAVSETLSRNAG